jgi:hypothetical protein
MGDNFCDLIRVDYNTRFVRYAVIRLLIDKKYPLKSISNKFNEFYRGIEY